MVSMNQRVLRWKLYCREEEDMEWQKSGFGSTIEAVRKRKVTRRQSTRASEEALMHANASSRCSFWWGCVVIVM